MVMYILYTSQQQNTLDRHVYIIHITPIDTLEGDVYIIHYTPTEHLRWCCKNYTHRNNRTPKMVMYILYTSPQQNTLDGDVYIIHISTTEYLRC